MSQPQSPAQGLTPQQQQQAQRLIQQQQQQMQPVPQPDPVMQAVIEADYRPIDLGFGEPNGAAALCGAHKLEKCDGCGVDFVNLNRLSRLLVANPHLLCPPPPQAVTQKLSMAINVTKEEGNTLYRTRQHEKAIQRYTAAANYACQRPPWEAQQYMREELTTILSNRSAAYFESGDYVSALADADAVVQLKRPWSKGHFRKAKALVGLGRIAEAKEAIRLGLQYEPQNAEMVGVLNDIEASMRKTAERKRELSSQPAKA